MACFDAKLVATFDYNAGQTQRNLHQLFTVMVTLEFGSLAVAVAARNNHYCFSPRERKFASLAPLKASIRPEFRAQWPFSSDQVCHMLAARIELWHQWSLWSILLPFCLSYCA